MKQLGLIFGMVLPFLSSMEGNAQSGSSPLSFELGIGYALFSPDDINNVLVAIDGEEVKNGVSFKGGVQYQFSDRIGIFTSVRYFSSSALGSEQIVTDETGPEPLGTFREKYEVKSLPVSLGVNYAVPLGYRGSRRR